MSATQSAVSPSLPSANGKRPPTPRHRRTKAEMRAAALNGAAPAAGNGAIKREIVRTQAKPEATSSPQSVRFLMEGVIKMLPTEGAAFSLETGVLYLQAVAASMTYLFGFRGQITVTGTPAT